MSLRGVLYFFHVEAIVMMVALGVQAGTGEVHRSGPSNAMIHVLLDRARTQIDAGNPAGMETAALAERMADSLHLEYEKACAWELLGIAWKIRGDNHKSIDYLFQALSFYQKNEDQREFAGVLRHIGETNRAAGNLDQAHDFLNRALGIFIKLNDTAGLAKTYDRLAATSYERHFAASGELKPEFQPLEHVPFDFRQLMKTDKAFRSRYNQTLHYITMARFFAEKAGLPRIIISTNIIRAALYTITYQFREAQLVYSSLLDDIERINAELELPLVKYNMALLYYKQKKFGDALRYAGESYKLAEKMEIPQYLFLTSGFIAQIHRQLGNFKEAYEYSHLSYLGRIAYFEKDINVKLKAMQLGYEIRNKQEELRSRKQQIMWLILAIVFVTGITTLFILILMRKNRAMRRLNESLEQRVALRTRELENSNRELAFRIREAQQYSYIASHDLKEPLQTLINFTGLLQEEYGQVIEGEGTKYLGFISRATERMSNLVKGFLDYSLLEKKDNNGKIDCNLLLQTILGELSDDIIQAGAAVEVEDLPEITGSVSDMKTLFTHLLRNAIQYRRPDVPLQIIILAINDQTEWRFFIEDNGSGIPEKERIRVFDIFRKGRKHNNTHSTGLGLAYCRKIVELHGGRIWAEPARQSGTIINFTIPKPQRYDQETEQHIAGG